jgi:PAS domain S-box-containing protein
MTEEIIQILLVEDDLDHAEIIQRTFEDQGDESELTIVHTLTDALKHLETHQPSLIIADWRLPDGDSSELLRDDPEKPSPPIIIMTGYGNERNAVNVIKSGALDYIVKSSESMTDMPHIAERAIDQWKMMQDKETIQVQLTESEAQFRLLAENSSDMISKHDTKGTFLYVSPACKIILGYEPSELIGISVNSLVHPDDTKAFMDMLTTPKENDQTVTVDYQARHKNGKYIWIETTARLFSEEASSRREIQASSRNINERKEAEAALKHAHASLQEAYDKTIEGWVRALDLRDNETEGHTQHVTEMAVKLAMAVGCSEDEIIHIRRGALLHDMGKMGIPNEILQKPGPLTEMEWKIIRRHPELAYQMLSRIEYLKEAIIIPYYHHERWDGSGYPHNLKGETFPCMPASLL